MAVRYSGEIRHVWPVSTGRSAYCTPAGTYRPYLLKRMHYSSKYDWAPMPFSIFFHRGYAIHGTTEINNLGTPASHGCIRLHPEQAETLFNLVQQHGKDQTLIRILP
ncbi:MAG: L,D-transpeptidase [Alphaproteobacteria bacterium]|nr:L,D-transpeptidase [Alphaproteobacteria bacterium]